MTAKQEAVQLINSVSDDDAAMILWILKRMAGIAVQENKEEPRKKTVRSLGGYKYSIRTGENFNDTPKAIEEYMNNHELFN